MHVGLTYEFHWPHSSLGACQTPWQYQYHFLDGVLCGATQLGIDINTAAAALTSKAHAIGVEGQVFTIVNGATDAAGGAAAIRPTWDVLNGWDRQSADDMSPDVIPHGARETVVAALTDPAEDHPDYPGARGPRTPRTRRDFRRRPHPPPPPPIGGVA